jgi:hypothetical protein
MPEQFRPAEVAERDRRSFFRKVGLASLGAAAAVPVLGRSEASAANVPVYANTGNTFTAPQVIRSGGHSMPPLTISGDVPGYQLHVRNRANNALIARVGSPAAGNDVAGVLVLHGTNGLGTWGAAWQVGVDVAVPPRFRDFFIAKVEKDDSVRDVIYIWNNGATEAPAVDLFPAGPQYPVNASVAINGQRNRGGDPPQLMLRPNVEHQGESFVIKVLTEEQPRFAINRDGAVSWGPGGTTAPGGTLGRGGATLERSSVAGLRLSHGRNIPRGLALHNSGAIHGDGTGIALMADGFTFARIDGTYYSHPGGKLSLQVANGSSSFAERITMDNLGIAFNGNQPFVVPTYGGATAGSSYGPNEQLMLNRLYNLIRTLGFFR